MGEVSHWQSHRLRPFTLVSWPGSARPGPSNPASIPAYVDGVRAAILAHPDAALVGFTVATERCHRCTQRLRTTADFDTTMCARCVLTVTPDQLAAFARLNAQYRAA
nr:hypothetical protein [Rhodococcus aetherivorans]